MGWVKRARRFLTWDLEYGSELGVFTCRKVWVGRAGSTDGKNNGIAKHGRRRWFKDCFCSMGEKAGRRSIGLVSYPVLVWTLHERG